MEWAPIPVLKDPLGDEDQEDPDTVAVMIEHWPVLFPSTLATSIKFQLKEFEFLMNLLFVLGLLVYLILLWVGLQTCPGEEHDQGGLS